MWNFKPPILIAEDDENDAHLLKYTLKKIGITNPIHIVPDGEEAISYLSGTGDYSNREAYPFPAVIITDIKMPRKNGFDVLRWLKSHPDCAIIPAVVWSSSAVESDVTKAYELGTNCYLKKPNDPLSWEETIKLLFTFWDVCEKPALATSNCAQAEVRK